MYLSIYRTVSLNIGVLAMRFRSSHNLAIARRRHKFSPKEKFNYYLKLRKEKQNKITKVFRSNKYIMLLLNKKNKNI